MRTRCEQEEKEEDKREGGGRENSRCSASELGLRRGTGRVKPGFGAKGFSVPPDLYVQTRKGEGTLQGGRRIGLCPCSRDVVIRLPHGSAQYIRTFVYIKLNFQTRCPLAGQCKTGVMLRVTGPKSSSLMLSHTQIACPNSISAMPVHENEQAKRIFLPRTLLRTYV